MNDPRLRPARHGVELIEDVPYLATGDRAHRLDVYRPTHVEGPLPIVMYVHGGAFMICSKETHVGLAMAFARRGYLVFNVEYRSSRTHPFPAAVSDVCDAYAWIVENAERYGGDLDRLAIAGESAGGNLVTSLAVALSYQRDEPYAQRAFACRVRPRAVLPACALLDVTRLERLHGRGPLRRVYADIFSDLTDYYLGGPIDRHTEALDLASPLRALERAAPPDRPLPPFFVSVGTFDPLVVDSQRLEAALARLGVHCEARYYPGGVHAFHAIELMPQTRRHWRDLFTFLGRVLG
jgi:acetyl esterase